MAGDRDHHEQVARTEQHILSHLSHHHATAEIYRDVNHLRAFDESHGHSFKRDLATINKHLGHETSRMHLPEVTIVDDAKHHLSLQPREHHYHLPKAVQHDISHEYHIARAKHQHHASRFVAPGDAAGSSNAENIEIPDPSGDNRMNTSDASPSKSGFGEALLTKLGLPVTQKNLDFLDKWQRAEGGSADNPFNTTQNAPGAHNFNSAGVKRYPTMEVGLDATVKTLQNGYYGGILRALAAENTQAATYALRASPWGTKNIA
jgi:hypothetical protein